MKISCIIVDDEPLAIKLLENFVARTDFLELRGSYTDSVKALAEIRTNPCDLLFLDIQMPDLSGMELAEMVPDGTRIIFTTAFKQYAFDSYGVNALDFLLKPIRYNKFLAAAEKARQWFELTKASGGQADGREAAAPANRKDCIYINVDRRLTQVRFDDILYIQGMKDYVVFVVENREAFSQKDKVKTLITHMTMNAVENSLPTDLFMRVNRSYVVALAKISSIDKNKCIYIGDEVVRVTDAYLSKFDQYITGLSPH